MPEPGVVPVTAPLGFAEPGVVSVVEIPGLSVNGFVNIPSAAVIFVLLDPSPNARTLLLPSSLGRGRWCWMMSVRIDTGGTISIRITIMGDVCIDYLLVDLAATFIGAMP